MSAIGAKTLPAAEFSFEAEIGKQASGRDDDCFIRQVRVLSREFRVRLVLPGDGTARSLGHASAH